MKPPAADTDKPTATSADENKHVAAPITRHAANMLGIDYRAAAAGLPYRQPIIDAHIHINDVAHAKVLIEVAQWFGIDSFWSQSAPELIDPLRDTFGDRFIFVAGPNYAAKEKDETFTTDWLHRLEVYRSKGARLAKFWAAPRGLDFHPTFRLDDPTRLHAMKRACELGYMLMFHVADPDTWFATKYRDTTKYGSKAEHYRRLENVLAQFSDTPVLLAHLAGHPEDLDHLQQLLDNHPNVYLDTSATKWMVRELSKHEPEKFSAFLRRNPLRVLFGSDIVVNAKDDPATVHDLYASRYWALRTLLETDYRGSSPIVDPDLHAVNPTLPTDSTASMNGMTLPTDLLDMLYHHAPLHFLSLQRSG